MATRWHWTTCPRGGNQRGALASLDSGGASLRVLTLVTFLCVCVSSVAPVSINIFIVPSFPGFFYLKKKCGSDASISEPARSNLNKINSNFQHISRSFSFEFLWVNRPTFWERCKQPVTKKKLKCIGSRKNVVCCSRSVRKWGILVKENHQIVLSDFINFWIIWIEIFIHSYLSGGRLWILMRQIITKRNGRQ